MIAYIFELKSRILVGSNPQMIGMYINKDV